MGANVDRDDRIVDNLRGEENRVFEEIVERVRCPST